MIHVPVLVEEIIKLLQGAPGDSLLDATIGNGGHAKAFLQRVENSKVLGVDADAKAIAVAERELEQFGDRVSFVQGNFFELEGLVGENKFDHVLFDLGIGSHQIADESRGFSFQSKDNLVMQFGGESFPPSQLTVVHKLEERLGHVPDALELINELKAESLAEIILTYGEDRNANAIAEVIKEREPKTGEELARVIAEEFKGKGRLHPATLTFQALRLAANRELEAIMLALPQAVAALKPGGKIAVLSWHSLEDRIVKRFFKRESGLQAITKRPVEASDAEVASNPRARSAKLRVATKNPAASGTPAKDGVNINTKTNNDSQSTTTSNTTPSDKTKGQRDHAGSGDELGDRRFN